jgi:hypothetical protein
LFLSKIKSTKLSSKESAPATPAQKLTPAQKRRLQKTLAKMPSIEKLDPKIYAKLQSTISDTVAKTLPEYQRWVNSSLIAADDCPVELCSSCGNDCPTQLCSACSNQCPTPIKNIDEIVVNAVNEAMMGAIRQALKKQFK